MTVSWRPATWIDIEPSLCIQVKNRGDALVGVGTAVEAWRRVARDEFFASCVVESSPAIQGHRIVGFAASVFVTRAFADAEVADPRPDMTSRIIASIHSGQTVLATRQEVARANAVGGVDVAVLCACWRDEILNPAERQDVQTHLASSLADWLSGFRVRRILHETADGPAKEFAQRSVVYKPIAEFTGFERVLHLMTRESVNAVPASIGGLFFNYREPVLGLRESDQQLLLAALGGATDRELTIELGVTFAAVKARWRSAFARIAETMPGLVSDADDREGRGMQKRHRVLAYVRSHPEELRPYDWKAAYERTGLPGRQAPSGVYKVAQPS